MTQDQIDFVNAIRTVSNELADYVEECFKNGSSFDEIHAKLRNAMAVVDGWRIGRGV